MGMKHCTLPPVDAARNQPTPQGYDRRLAIWGAGVLLFFMVVTRFAGLGTHEPWHDEIYSWTGARDNSPLLWQWWPAGNDEHAPLPFIEIKLSLALFGDSPWALRLPAACYAVLSVMAVYLVVGRFVNWATAWWAALLLACNPYVLEHHRDARMYPGWMFYLILSIAVAATASSRACLDRPRRNAMRWWLGLGMLFMLMFATTTHALLNIAGIIGWLILITLIHWHHGRRSEAWTIVRGTAVCLCAFIFNWSALGLIKLADELNRISTNNRWIFPTLHDLQVLAGELVGYVSEPLAATLWIGALIGLWCAARRGHWPFILLVVMAGGSSLLGFSSIVARHSYVSRYLFGSLLIWSIGLGALAHAAWQGQRLHPRWLGRSLVIAVITVMAVSWAPLWMQIYTIAKNPIAQVLQAVRTQSKRGDSLVVVPRGLFNIVRYQGTSPATPRAAMQWHTQVDRHALPDTTWVFVYLHAKHLHALEQLIEAYGLRSDHIMPTILIRTENRAYCTFRISPKGIDFLTVSPPSRTFQCQLITAEP